MPDPRTFPLCAPGDTVAFGGRGAANGAPPSHALAYERLGARVERLAEASDAEVVVLLAPDRGDLEAAEHAIRPGGTLFVEGPLDPAEAVLAAPHCVHAELRIEFGDGRAD
jgi:hypothetical protein